MNDTNPFRAKALRARALADALSEPSVHEQAMANAFPLGAGFGRGSQRKRERSIDAVVAMASKAVDAVQRARILEAKADAFDRGEINVQGRSISMDSVARSERVRIARESRQARIDAAKVAIAGMSRLEVSAELWADAYGFLGGSGRKLVIAEHEEAQRAARARGEDPQQ